MSENEKKEKETVNEKETVLGKVETEAIKLLENFKESPLKSIIYAFVIIWVVKQIKNIWNS